MKKMLISLLVGFSFQLSAQEQVFQKTDSLRLDSLQLISAHWINLRGAVQFDLVLQTLNDDSSSLIHIVDWETKERSLLIPDSLSSEKIIFEDLDNNNELDIISINQNQSGFSIYYQSNESFRSYSIDSLYIDSYFMSDWNNDGLKDILFTAVDSSSKQLSVIYNDGQSFASTPDSLYTFNASYEPQIFDIDQDGKHEIILLPKKDSFSESPVVLFRVGSELQEAVIDSISGGLRYITSGDFNHDGKLDFLAEYFENDSSSQALVFSVDSTNWSVLNKLSLLDTNRINSAFMADFNSDGNTDVFLRQNHQQYLYTQADDSTLSTLMLNTDSVQLELFTDYDFDGDLDMMVLGTDSGAITLEYMKNITPEQNFQPSLPEFSTAFNVGNEVYLVWSESVDDHTRPKNISYDVFVGKNTFDASFYAPDFDLNSSYRLKTKRGNNLFSTLLKLKNLENGTYNYGIQPIDNSLSFHVQEGECADSCPCEGRYLSCGNFESCDSTLVENIIACKNEILEFNQDSMQVWFNATNNIIEFSTNFSFEATENDTLYMAPMNASGCPPTTIFAISILEDNFLETDEIVLCNPGSISLGTTYSFDSLKWYNSAKQYLGEGDSITVEILENEQIIVEGYYRDCVVTDTTSIIIDDSQIRILNSPSQIRAGGNVNLQASKAVSYFWYPPEGLNQTDIQNPIASPEITTLYFVEGTSERGCVSVDSVLIEVEQQAFIPEMFSPNGDGKNDQLKLYGLRDVKTLEFSIYDRSGNLIYRTNDAQKMLQMGWDGYSNGVKAEGALYFWQIRGEYNDGQPILLNGKDKGKFLLSR